MLVWIIFFASCIGLIGLLADKIVMNELKLITNKIIERSIK